MPIHDVGYRRWPGNYSHSLVRWYTIARSGIQIVYKSVWVRRMLLVTWLPALYFGVGLFFFERAVKEAEEQGISTQFAYQVIDGMLPPIIDRSPIEQALSSDDFGESRPVIWGFMLVSLMRYPQAFWVVLLVGLIAPPLISKDVRSRAFLLYFSKPINRYEYILGKLAVLIAYLGLICTLPVLGLYLFGVFLSPSWTILLATWDFPFRIILASAAFIIPASCVALMFSSLTTEARYAGFAWFALWGLGGFAWIIIQTSIYMQAYQEEFRPDSRNQVEVNLGNGQGVTINHYQTMRKRNNDVWETYLERSKNSLWSLLSMYDTLGRVQGWIFGVEKNFVNVWPSLVMLVLQTSLSIVILIRRISAPINV